MSKKISDKDKKDWENFISNKQKIPNKDFIFQKKIRQEKIKKIDLHGYTLEEANNSIEEFIQNCFDDKIRFLLLIIKWKLNTFK
ncbi:Smr/MutS family protein [Pelagibacterales bacterium SAG-MED20]|nr:Smr/MutS family protein [Pelagibacterales bacterium SAG-MED20]